MIRFGPMRMTRAARLANLDGMFDTIVVGCTGTDADRDALALTIQLSRPGARLHLTHIEPVHRGLLGTLRPPLGPDWLPVRARDLRDQLPVSVEVTTATRSGPSPAAGLTQAALELDADLIVLGPSHRRRAGQLAGRKTVQRLLHRAPCAVAVAGPHHASRLRPWPQLLVAYDGSAESEQALRCAYATAAAHSGSVLLCGVVALEAAGEEPWRRHALEAAALRAPEGVAVRARLLWGDPAPALLKLARHEADLLVTGTRRHGGLRRALEGSVSGVLLRDGVSVLVTPLREPIGGGGGGPRHAAATD